MLVIIGMSGLKFTEEYRGTIYETPHADHDPQLLSDPPTPKAGVVANATCVNNDGNPVEDSIILYSILNGNGALFSIDEMTGHFSVANVPFDYEEQPWYLVHLFCHLSSDPNNNGTGTVNISIGHLNEFLPTISNSLSTIPILETTPNGTIIAATDHSLDPLATYAVTDRDTGPDGVIIYTLHASRSNNDDKLFDLNRVSGTLTLNALLDVDNLPSGFQKLEISITVCNMNVSLDLCQIIDLIVFVTAANDIAPAFTEQLYTASVSELELKSSLILQAECMDDDVGNNKETIITFPDNTPRSILAMFEITLMQEMDFSLVNISLLSELDYENTTGYAFELVCSDGVHSAEAHVMIAVISVNEFDPHFTQSVYPTRDRVYSEGDYTSHVIASVQCTDSDLIVGAFESIQLQSSTVDLPLVLVELADGRVDLALDGNLDFEMIRMSEITVHLLCLDSGTPARSDTANVTLRIQGVNDEPVRFTQSEFNFTVDRLELPGIVVGQLETEDDDIDSPQPNITYSIEENANFDIDDSGQVLLQGVIFLIEGDHFNLTVTASDGENDDATAVVIVNVDGYFSVADIICVIAGALLLAISVAVVSCIYCVYKRRR